MRVRGTYTIEAVFIVSICVWVLAALCYGGMYVHDRVVLETMTNEETAAWMSRSDSPEETEWCDKLREQLDGKLFLFQVKRVQLKSGIQNKKIQVYYTVSISWDFLRKVLTDGNSELLYETVREDIMPAKYMWDREIVKER